MKIAITGATGFIGRYMVKGMLAAGHSVRVLCRPGRERALELPAPSPSSPGVEVHIGDLLDRESLRGFLAGADYILHLASAHDHFADDDMQRVNVRGTEYLLDEAKTNAPTTFQFVVISSAVIGVPVYSYYRDSKRVQEKIIRGSGLRWASFRPTLVYGVGDWRHTAPFFRKCAAKGGTYWVFHEGLSKINPVHVEDLVDAVARFLRYDRAKEVDLVFEIAGPAGVPYNEFVDMTIQATGGKVKRRNIPRRWVERALLLKALFTDVTRERRGAGYFSLHHDHDIGPARIELGWEPRPYSQGVIEVARGEWWRSEGPPVS